ncbi:hypothetical protein ACLOJK_006255 [Asimina triloba]
MGAGGFTYLKGRGKGGLLEGRRIRITERHQHGRADERRSTRARAALASAIAALLPSQAIKIPPFPLVSLPKLSFRRSSIPLPLITVDTSISLQTRAEITPLPFSSLLSGYCIIITAESV